MVASVVFHSHRYSYLEHLERNVDDGFANRLIVGRQVADDAVAPSIAAQVRDDWRYLAECGLGAEVLLCPVEEILWSKGYIQERERYDGADIAHLHTFQSHVVGTRAAQRAGAKILRTEHHIQYFIDASTSP